MYKIHNKLNVSEVHPIYKFRCLLRHSLVSIVRTPETLTTMQNQLFQRCSFKISINVYFFVEFT